MTPSSSENIALWQFNSADNVGGSAVYLCTMYKVFQARVMSVSPKEGHFPQTLPK